VCGGGAEPAILQREERAGGGGEETAALHGSAFHSTSNIIVRRRITCKPLVTACAPSHTRSATWVSPDAGLRGGTHPANLGT
jgi:hypothetical protein